MSTKTTPQPWCIINSTRLQCLRLQLDLILYELQFGISGYSEPIQFSSGIWKPYEDDVVRTLDDFGQQLFFGGPGNLLAWSESLLALTPPRKGTP